MRVARRRAPVGAVNSRITGRSRRRILFQLPDLNRHWSPADRMASQPKPVWGTRYSNPHRAERLTNAAWSPPAADESPKRSASRGARNAGLGEPSAGGAVSFFEASRAAT